LFTRKKLPLIHPIQIRTYIHTYTLSQSPSRLSLHPCHHITYESGRKRETKSITRRNIPPPTPEVPPAAPPYPNQNLCLSLNMCHHTLSIYPCGDSYITPSSLCGSGPRCTVFKVVSAQRHMVDCFPCQRSPRRRRLPARARGIYAPS